MRDEREWDLVREGLKAASLDPTDFGRFVNRPSPGVIEPSSFDSVAATPVLMEWLPKVSDTALKQTIIGRLRNPAAKGVATLTGGRGGPHRPMSRFTRVLRSVGSWRGRTRRPCFEN